MYILYIVPAALRVLPSATSQGTQKVPFSSAVLCGAPLFDLKGTRTVPFFIAALRGILLHDLVWRNKSASLFIFGTQGPLCCKYFSKNHLWLVIVILKSLNLVVSCIPVLYYVYCICFMLFRSTCSWPFFWRKPTQGSFWGPKYTSCILYLVYPKLEEEEKKKIASWFFHRPPSLLGKKTTF